MTQGISNDLFEINESEMRFKIIHFSDEQLEEHILICDNLEYKLAFGCTEKWI